MTTKEITLSISERVAVSKILNDFKGSITQLAIFLDDIKKIAITEEEWTAASLTKTPIKDEHGEDTGREQWNWKDEEDQLKTIELDGETVNYITGEIKKRSDANEITVEDVSLITVNKKFLQ